MPAFEPIPSFHIIGSKESGGAERFYARLVNGLTRQGQPVTAITPPASMIAAELAPAVRQLPVPMRSVWDFPSRWKISALARRDRPAIIQTYMGRATRLTHLKRGQRPVHVARLGGYYDLKGYRHAHAWVGNTRGICDYLIQNGLPAKRVFYIGNFVEPGVPLTDSEQALHRQALGLPRDVWVVSAVGRLHPNKGMADLLEAFRLLPDQLAGRPLWLALAGDGPLRAELHQYASQLGISDRVRWLGWQADPVPVYRAADVFVCPSRHEPLGNVILEAWAQGVAVVSSRSAGALELIEDGVDGMLTPVGDARALAGTVRALLDNPRDGAVMAANARRKLEVRFSEARIVGDYLAMYRQLLGRLA